MHLRPSRALNATLAAVAGIALTVGGAVLPAQAADNSPAVIRPTEGALQVNLLGFNDFHGRVTSADRFAGAALDAEQGYANNVVVSSGDAVGASLFESATQDDKPTIDALNVLGVDAWTAGNHEFDKGLDHYSNTTAPATHGDDLAANVTDANGNLPAGLKPYSVITTADGVRVGIIGAVTQETPTLVSPDGVKGFTFGDPVAAVNTYADQLTDGIDDAASGNLEADVVVASYHEGGPVSKDYDADMANSVFAHIVNDTSAKVGVILNAHTHQTYAYEAPVPGASDQTRPVIQTGSYAANVGQVVLTLDPATKKVTSADLSNIAVPKEVPASVANSQKIADIKRIIADAVAEANKIGEQQLATGENPTRAYSQWNVASVDATTGAVTGTHGGDDRANASALGDLVADSMMEQVNATDYLVNAGLQADGAIVNPGGLRADLDQNNDGIITYREAATVMPFANNLSVLEISGADFKKALEQQWQPAGASRPYLQLGLSDSLTYTYSEDGLVGERIHGVFLNGVPVTADQTLKLVMPTFLTAGGDNFTALTSGTQHDTGLADLEAFRSWLETKKTITIDNQRQGVEATHLNGNVQAGTSAKMTFKRFDMASEHYVQNNSVTVTLDGVEVGKQSFTTPNTTEVEFTVPAGTTSGLHTFKAVFAPSGTTSYFQVDVVGVDPVAAPTVTTDNDSYTVTQTKDGVMFTGEHWTPSQPFTVLVTDPAGKVTEMPDFGTATAEGQISGTLDLKSVDENGAELESGLPWPVGGYELTIGQKAATDPISRAVPVDLTASTKFQVVEDGTTGPVNPTASPTTEPTADPTAVPPTHGGDLAETGADANLMFGVIAAALVLLAIGGTLVVVRRRRAAGLDEE